MKNTSLTHIHKQLGAKMVPFAGFNMPVQYEGVKAEHQTVRTAVGVFDVSHMGEFLLEGPNALELIQKISSNDASKLAIGDAQYTCMPNEQGGIVDDLLIYRVKKELYLLVVNASNIEKDWNWIEKHNNLNVAMKNISDIYSLLAIQGPKTIEALQSLTSVNLSAIPFYKFIVGDFAGIKNVIISATGYTGAGGFEIYCKNDEVALVWEKIFKAGKDFGIKPIGLAARDTLRLEMGYCLYGNDINDNTSPIEAGLSWVTKFNKNFINKENLETQKKNGVAKKLIGFEVVDKGIARQNYPIVDMDGNKIGIVTSGTMSPSLNKAIGLGYVKDEFTTTNSYIFIEVRKKKLKAKVVKLPFYKG